MKKILLSLLVLTGISVQAQKIWNGSAGNGSWSTAANWTPSGIPTAADDVIIPTGSTVDSNGGSVQSITLEGNAVLNLNGSLTFSQTSVLEAASVLNWSIGNLSGAGTLQADGTINLTTTNNKSLTGGFDLENGGTINFVDVGDLYITNATLRNLAAGVIDMQVTQGNLSYSSGSSHVLENLGLIRASADATVMIQCELINTGTLQVESGNMSLNYSDIYLDGGQYDVSSGATLTWNSFLTIHGLLTGVVDGEMVWTSGIDVPESAGIDFGGNGQVRWDIGSLGGGGTFTNESLITLATSNNKSLIGGGVFNNNGEMRFVDVGDIYVTDITFNNNPGALIDLQVESGNLSYSSGNSHVLNNYGIIRKSVASGGVSIQCDLHNEGTIESLTGSLVLNSPAISFDGGNYNISSGAFLVLQGTQTITGELNGNLNGEIYWIGTVNVPEGQEATFDFTVGGSGNVNWGNGLLTGGGTLNNESLMRLSTTNNKTLTGATTWNNSALVYLQSGGDLYITNGVVNNLVSGTFELRTDDANLSYSSGPLHQFNNMGILRRNTSSGNALVNCNMTNTGTVEVISGTLTLNGVSDTDLTGGIYNVSDGATLAWNGLVNLSGSLEGTLAGNISSNASISVADEATLAFQQTGAGRVNWENGTLIGGGTLTNESHLALTSPNNKNITGGTTLNNSNLMFFEGVGDIYITDGVLNNLSTGEIDLRVDAGNLSYSSGPSHILNNSGLIRRSTSTGTALIQCEMHNSGTISVESGTLGFAYDGISAEGGSYTISESAHLSWDAPVHISGELLGQNNGTFSWNNTVSVAGTASLTLSGSQPLNWTIGQLNGGGTFTNNSDMLFTTSNNKLINGGTVLNNNGTITFNPDGVGDLYIVDGTLNNEPSGEIRLMSDQPSLSYSSGTDHILNNYGLIRKSASTGTSQILCELNNFGTVEVASGTIEFTGNFPFTNAPQGILSGLGTFDLPLPATYSNAGNIAPGPGSNAVLSILGTYESETTSSLNINLNGPSDFDKIMITGAAAFNGTVNVNLGYGPAIDDSFVIATTSSPITVCGLDPATTAVFNGLEYEFSVSCQNDMNVILTVTDISPAPPVADPQTLCNGATIANLEAEGANLNWYANANGGAPLPATTVLVTEDYFVTQTIDGFESDRLQVMVTIHTTEVPSAASPQNFNSGATVADLAAQGSNLQWYAQANGGAPLSPGTPLVDGTYYVSQTIDDCESDLMAVSVNLTSEYLFYADADSDGFGAGNLVSVVAEGPQNPPTGYSLDGSDCDDDDATIWQSALLYLDQDSDGYDSGQETVCYGMVIPEFYSETTLGTDCDDQASELSQSYPFFVDADGDGFGTMEVVMVCAENAATPPSGFATNNTDCDDSDAAIWEGVSYFIDADQDGYDAGSSLVCAGETVPSGYYETTMGTDCDDSDAQLHQSYTFFVDGDNDGFGSMTTALVCAADASTAPEGYATNDTDCDDTDADAWQSAEVFIDNDGDGFDSGTTTLCYGSEIPEGYSIVSLGLDCDDSDAAVNPDAEEIPGNGIDDNCNGETDEGGEIPTTSVIASQCGATLESIGTPIEVTSVPGATAYRFRVHKPSTGQTIYQTATMPYYNLMSLPSISFGTTYVISVQVQYNNVWTNVYGPECSVTTPAAGTGPSVLNPVQCDGTLSTITSLIATSSDNAASGYRFRLTNLTDPSAPNQVQTLDRIPHFFSLQMLQSYAYGTTYLVEIATLVNGNYTNFGPACTISTPSVPTLADCGNTVVTSPNQFVFTTSMLKATAYRFEVTDMGSGTVTVVERPNHYFQFQSVPGFNKDRSYSVRVSVKTADTWSPYGAACGVNTTINARQIINLDQQISLPFKAVAYPSPFADNFRIRLQNASTGEIQILLYDMTGRKIMDTKRSAETFENETFGNALPSGVYNLVLTQDENVSTLRIIKR